MITDKEIIFDIINDHVNGVNTYHNNGSMWFIFTDDKKWVIELTNEGTLWYNFYFFQDCFKYLSLDVVENQHYITEWVEDTIQNGVRSTDSWAGKPFVSVESVIQNGVKETTPGGYLGSIEMKGKLVHQFESPKQNNEVEDAIQNGVRNTQWKISSQQLGVEETIENGIKLTEDSLLERIFFVEDTIENGIKETNWRKVDNHPTYVDHVINSSHHETKQTLVV